MENIVVDSQKFKWNYCKIQEVPFLDIDLRFFKVQMQRHLYQPRAALFTHAGSQVPSVEDWARGRFRPKKDGSSDVAQP